MVFLNDQKSKDKSLNILKTKRAFMMKQKTYFIIFHQGLLLKQIKSPFLQGESQQTF